MMLTRFVARRGLLRSGASARFMAMKPSEEFLWNEPIPPGHTLESIKPPKTSAPPPKDSEPDANEYVRGAVTSAHMIDAGKVSTQDSAALSPSKTVVHGRYGDLGAVEGIPLEYLALLHPAAEAAAGLRVLGASTPGTVLVYGAGQANGLAAVQLGSAAGHAVVAVVEGQTSGNFDMMSIIKGLASEPGTAVPEEYALVKKNFADLVDSTVSGDKLESTHSKEYLIDFKENVLAYAQAYPETRPAAVGEAHLDFYGKDKDRENFRENLDPYLHQFTAGSPPLDPAKLDSSFTAEQYSVFKSKFNSQTTAVITGDDSGHFNPAEIVSTMMQSPEPTKDAESDFEFSLTRSELGIEAHAGGPIIGGLIALTSDLEVAAKAVDKAGSSKRAKAEALQFLTASQRNAFAAASSVARLAAQAGAPVYTLGGSLPGFQGVKAKDVDVQKALAAMATDDRGFSQLNFFIQIYRANDFPIYEDYAVFRASEELPGPRQIVVTK